MRHIFSFEHGDELTTMGATWFVSYAWYDCKDNTHLNWQNVKTSESRRIVYDNTREFHRYFLEQIIKMDRNRLSTNKIELSGSEVIEMAQQLLLENKDSDSNVPTIQSKNL